MTYCNYCGGTTAFISDNIVKCVYCGRLYSISNGELSSADSEKLYCNAVKMSTSKDQESVKKAIEIFEALGGYKDSPILADSCRGMIAQSRVQEEERRLAAERQAELEQIESKRKEIEEKQKAKIKRIIIASVSAVVVIVVVINVIVNYNKSLAYNDAVELYGAGQYEEARAVFDDLGDYSDASTYVSTIDTFLMERESKYEKGISYYERGAYSECITSLVDISDYLDSKSYIDKSAEAIYQQASDCLGSGNYEKAKELLVQVPDGTSKYMDVELMLADINEIIKEQTNAENYEYAIECYDNGDYETAQRLFVELKDYNDTSMYLSTIGDSYYEQATLLFEQNDYVKCGEILSCIDSAEEWTDYSKAIQLMEIVKEVYRENVSNEAKNICRSEGNSSMQEYIDNNICLLLSSDEASILKKECDIEIISFDNLEPYAGTYEYQIGGERTDTMGNTYAYTFRGCSGIKSGHYLLYDISGRYKYFNATVAVEKQSGGIGEEYVGHIRVYGDDRLLWSDDNIRGTTKPYEIQVDVENVVDLRIELNGDVPFTGPGVRVLLGNPTLSE